MAELVLSFAAQHINEDSDALIISVGSEARALSNDLVLLEKSLVDAGRTRQGMANNEQVQAWFIELRKIAYEAEDLVDSLISSTDCTAFSNLRHLKRARQASKKLRGFRERVKEIKSTLNKEGSSKKNLRVGLVSGALSLFQQAHQDLRADDGFVVGIEADVDRLVKMLLSNSQDGIAIVGMGGSGKTTLAKNLYNHREVNTHFKYKAWVSLSQNWDASHELHRFDSLPSFHDQGDGDDGDGPSSRVLKKKKLQLQNLLTTESCLVVLDDVWDWKPFQKMLNELLQEPSTSSSDVFRQSKIVFTSRRLPSPADTHLNWAIHETKSLNEKDSWKLFKKMSRNDTGKKLDREYRGLAMEMLRKCKGLPLAIVALGRLLKRKDSIEEWERVFSQLKGDEGSHLYEPINDILALSYNELPHYLKPCFLYMGLLAEDSTIPAGMLKRMWIAEGFVKGQRQEGETSEDTARRLLQELVNHTMVQVVSKTYTGKVNTIRLHDMMRDICINIARKLDFLTLFPSDSDQVHSRRAAINLSKCSRALPNNTSLRSLLLSRKSSTGKQHGGRMNNQQGIMDLALVFEKFKLLRVLDINGIKTYDGTMPKELGNLIHLRYLGIRSTNIQVLPRSIGKLHKLLTFDYWDVTIDNEIRLPNVFWKLMRLRHLFLPNEMMSNTMADMRFDTLLDLQTLWGVKGGDWMLKEMDKLSVKLTKLFIQGISSALQLKAVFDSSMIEKYDNLHALCLDWYGFSLESESLRKLSSKKNLKKLRLMGRARNKPQLPLKFPSSLWKLELYYTHLEDSETLNAIGELPNLKFLGLSKDSFTGSQWTIRKESKFRCLEELKLSYLPKLNEWYIESDTMPHLKKLSIISCTGLKQIPEGLKSITTLETLNIRHMPTSFNNRFRGDEGKDFHIVQHIPNVWVKDSCTQLVY
uniref:Uncharacterized protein n=1 Tax=Chenopodium quinoa TaxID=63459 RepID=A0A803KWP9_CHEQI